MLELTPTNYSFCIADVERETGLNKDTLRVWERRYGFPQPMRDGRGDRRYDEDQLTRLKVIKRLMDCGFRPGNVVSLEMRELQALCKSSKVVPAQVASRQKNKSVVPGSISAEWLDWLRSNQVEQFRRTLKQHFISHGLANTIHMLIAPLCVEVGNAWLAGNLSIFQEHLFSETIQSALREAISGISNSGTHVVKHPRVLLTTPPDERHVLGLLMAECIFALEECERIAIGANTPVSEIVSATRQISVDIVALSFSSYSTTRDVRQVLWQLDEQLAPGIQVWAGGSALALQSRRNLPRGVVLVRNAIDISNHLAQWRAKGSNIVK